MKKFLSVLSFGVLLAACNKSDNTPDPPAPPPTPPVDSTSTLDIRGTISTDQHWTKSRAYRLRGYVYVTNGATLTIDPGTKIVSNKDSAGVLVIYSSAKINAAGTAAEPIVFTSAEATPAPGDLGGVIIAGLATRNGNHSVIEGGVDAQFAAFGGTNDADNSGTLKYVRIEYAGKAVNPGDEVNGLSLYAVGSGTTIDYVQIVRGLDDAFEFFGGTVNCKHLFAYKCADDDFDMDDGYRGKIQFAISIKDPGFTDPKGTTGDLSNNFEVDNVNPSNGFTLNRAPITFPVLSNFTAVGPNGAAGTSSDYGYGMRWRRGAKFILANSIVIGGQKAGLDVEQDSTASYYATGTSKFYNSLLQSYASPFRVSGTGTFLDSTALATLTLTANGSQLFTNAADIQLTDAFSATAPNLMPQTSSPALSTMATFDAGTLSDAFFEKVTFIGALNTGSDWTAGWTVVNK